jgi:hypothetical protein
MMFAASLVVLLASGQAQEVVSVPAAAAAVDMAEYDRSVQTGQARYLAGDYVGAARTWVGAARSLPRTQQLRGDVAAIFGYVADAYDRALLRAEDPEVLREALAVIDEQAQQFAAAYPDVPALPRVEAVRERLRRRLAVIDAVDVEPEPEPVKRGGKPLVVRPWRPLAIGGGAALVGGAAMMVVFGVGLARVKAYEDGLQAAAMTCQLNGEEGQCGGWYDDYRWANTLQLTGMILGPALLGTGAALIIAAVKRKRIAARAQVSPLLGRGMFGVGLQRQF